VHYSAHGCNQFLLSRAFFFARNERVHYTAHMAKKPTQPKPGYLTAIASRKIVEMRLAAGMSQRQLSERASISNGCLRNVEAGRVSDARIDTLEAIAYALGTTVSALIDGR